MIGIKAEQNLVDTYSEDHQFTVEDLHLINKTFLGEIYPWAGTYRTVNLSKGGFPFATAFAIPKAMEKFEQGILSKNTPCNIAEIEELSGRIALVHVEFLLIHPYREGNGRTARLLATLSAYQAGMPGIDFSFIRGRGKEFDRYVRAIQLGIKQEYGLMQEIIERALRLAQQSMRGA